MDKEWKPFFQNCVSEIRSLTPVQRRSHCSGKDNPADVPSRGLTPLEFSVNLLWRDGSMWLSDRVDDREEQVHQMPEGCIAKMKAANRNLVHGLRTTDSTTDPEV